MNYIRPVAKMLKVEVNKPFRVSAKGGYTHLLKFKEDNLYIYIDDKWQVAYGLVWNKLLNGTLRILYSEDDA